MSLSKEQAARLNRGLDLLIERLNAETLQTVPGYTPQDLPYRICAMPDHKDAAFGIAHRAPIGKRHASGNKWDSYKGPSVADCELIGQTSHTEDEIVTQFRRFIFEHVRPLRTRAGQQIDEAAINQIVNERLKVLLDEKIKEIMQRQTKGAPSETVPEDNLIRPATQPQPPEEPNALLLDGPRLLDLWTQRAEEIGLKPPKITKNGRIDGRWLINAQEKWHAHEQKHTTAAS
jgi:hypothetical protein